MNSTKVTSIALAAASLAALGVGVVLQHEANFSNDYVHEQFAAQRITFSPVDQLSPQQRDVPCLVDNADEQLLTGKQAECYALNMIGLDLAEVGGGATYADVALPAKLKRDEANAAVAADPTVSEPETAALLAAAAEAEVVPDILFKGETLKGLLLTSYGFSIMGDRAGQAAMACFILAGLLALVAIANAVFGRPRRLSPTSGELSSEPESRHGDDPLEGRRSDEALVGASPSA